VLFELWLVERYAVHSLVASFARGLRVGEQAFVYHGVEVVDYAGSADAALEAVVDVGPDCSAVGAVGLYAPEVA